MGDRESVEQVESRDPMNAELEKKARGGAKKLWDGICYNHEHDGWGGSLARCHDCLTAALLMWGNERLEEAAEIWVEKHGFDKYEVAHFLRQLKEG